MPAKLGGYRSPNGIRKPQIKVPTQKPGKTIEAPSLEGFKKGGMVKRKKKK